MDNSPEDIEYALGRVKIKIRYKFEKSEKPHESIYETIGRLEVALSKLKAIDPSLPEEAIVQNLMEVAGDALWGISSVRSGNLKQKKAP